MHVGIFGLSGAGKTTLANRLVRLDGRFVAISASLLIKERGGVVSYNELGRDRIFSNQGVLVEAYKEFKVTHPNTLIELHSVIESEQGVVDVDPGVLRELGLDLAFFLKLDPCLLHKRRRSDLKKRRREVEVLELELLQVKAIEICQVALGGKLRVVKSEVAFSEIKNALFLAC